MLIVRETFTAKPGQASKFAKLMKKAFGNEPNIRIMTDYIGDYNTVVMEMSVKNMTEFDTMMQEYSSGKAMKDMDPEVAKEMAHYSEMYQTGKREVFKIVE